MVIVVIALGMQSVKQVKLKPSGGFRMHCSDLLKRYITVRNTYTDAQSERMRLNLKFEI